MSNQLSDGLVEYADGTNATVAQMSKDVTTFLMWAADLIESDIKWVLKQLYTYYSYNFSLFKYEENLVVLKRSLKHHHPLQYSPYLLDAFYHLFLNLPSHHF